MLPVQAYDQVSSAPFSMGNLFNANSREFQQVLSALCEALGTTQSTTRATAPEQREGITVPDDFIEHVINYAKNDKLGM